MILHTIFAYSYKSGSSIISCLLTVTEQIDTMIVHITYTSNADRSERNKNGLLTNSNRLRTPSQFENVIICMPMFYCSWKHKHEFWMFFFWDDYIAFWVIKRMIGLSKILVSLGLLNLFNTRFLVIYIAIKTPTAKIEIESRKIIWTSA